MFKKISKRVPFFVRSWSRQTARPGVGSSRPASSSGLLAKIMLWGVVRFGVCDFRVYGLGFSDQPSLGCLTKIMV